LWLGSITPELLVIYPGVDARTIIRIALCVAGTIRVSEDYTVFELPLAKDIDAYKLNRMMPPKSRDLLNTIIKSHGGQNLVFERDYLQFEVPAGNAASLEDELKDWIELDKASKKLFNLNKLIQYPGSMESDTGTEPGGSDPSEAKERGVVNERGVGGKGGKKERGKAAPGEGNGFRVEIPISVRGLTRRLHNNPHIKSLLEEYGGRPGKGEGLVLDFPDRGRRSEILDEISDAISGSGFLKEVLDVSEI
jgi:hypothetical protein